MNKMNWSDLLSAQRPGPQFDPSNGAKARTDFHKDYDRIAFSPTFRRLGKKTQVHPLVQNDHVHSRLTHSLEVSIVGRSLGMVTGDKIRDHLPAHLTPTDMGQILQAACLAHDLGNPPFGHAGEDAIQSWFSDPQNAHYTQDLAPHHKADLCSFEGNAQGFRLVAQIEHYPGEGGMRLTHSTLASMLKYPWTSDHKGAKRKFSVFQSEKDLLKQVVKATGLIEKKPGHYCRHPLAFLAEAADDICYRIIDLEDAFEMDLMSFDDIHDLYKPLIQQSSNYTQIVCSKHTSNRNKLSYIRAKVISAAIEGVSNVFAEHEKELLNGEFTGELIDYCPQEVRAPLNQAKKIANERIFKEKRKLVLELGCYTTLGTLLEAFCSAVQDRVRTEGDLCYKSSRVMHLMGFDAPKHGDDLYESLLKVTDYISGMTDHYASHMARQLSGIGQ